MSATYTTNLKLTKQGTGDNAGTWSVVLNGQVIDLTDEALAGCVTVSLASASATFTIPNGSSSDGRHAIIELTGNISGNDRLVTLPATVTKWWLFRNLTTYTTGTVKVKTNGGSNEITIPNGATRLIYSNGVEAYDLLGDASLVGKQTLSIPASYLRPLTTNAPTLVQMELAAGNPEVVGYLFPKGIQKYLQFDFTPFKAWNGGTFTVRFRWTTIATDTDGVRWNIAALSLGDGDNINSAYGTAVGVTDNAQSGTYKKYRSAETAAVTAAGSNAEGDELIMKVTRDIAHLDDTITEDVILTGLEFFITTNKGNDA